MQKSNDKLQTILNKLDTIESKFDSLNDRVSKLEGIFSTKSPATGLYIGNMPVPPEYLRDPTVIASLGMIAMINVSIETRRMEGAIKVIGAFGNLFK